MYYNEQIIRSNANMAVMTSRTRGVIVGGPARTIREQRQPGQERIQTTRILLGRFLPES